MYESINFDQLLGTAGFSDELLNNHFKLYQGYVKNTNAAAELLKDSITNTYAYGEVKRRFGWEFSGMRLHELYFGNLVSGGSTQTPDSPLMTKLITDFGSVEAWEADFKATASMRGIGWVILYHDPIGDRLFNVWINEHDLGHLAGAKPLLVLDVFEHAFVTDYGLNKADYLAAFWNAINWDEVEKRFAV